MALERLSEENRKTIVLNTKTPYIRSITVKSLLDIGCVTVLKDR